MAEGGAGAAREHGGRGVLERRAGRAADGVDAEIDRIQASITNAAVDRVLAQADSEQVPAGHVPVQEQFEDSSLYARKILNRP